VTSRSCKLGPAIWSRDTGQRIPCFDRCQLIITWMSNIKEVHGKPRSHICQSIIWSMAAMLGKSVVVAVVHTRPRAIPLAMITMRKSTHGFLFLSYMSMGLRLAALRVAGAPLKRYPFFVANSKERLLLSSLIIIITNLRKLRQPRSNSELKYFANQSNDGSLIC